MSEHYPEHAIGEKVPAWCGRCRRHTDHLIVRHSEHAGKIGHCVECPVPPPTKKQQREIAARQRDAENPRLFR